MAKQDQVEIGQIAQRDLALAYVERRLTECEDELNDQLAGTGAFPLHWRGFPRPSATVESHLVIICERKQEFLEWIRERIMDGNEAWTEQCAALETENRQLQLNADSETS